MTAEGQIAKMGEEVRTFVAERGWERFHNPRELAVSLSIEVGELLELFQWEEKPNALSDPKFREALEGEVADVMIYLVSLANVAGIDLAKAFQKKLAANRARFPPEKVWGKAGWGSRDV